MEPYNPNKPFISMKLDGSLLDRLVEAGIPFTRALQYFRDNPEGSALETVKLAAEDVIPFYGNYRNGGSLSDYAKEALLMALPTRAGKMTERSMFKPKDPNKHPVELSHKPIEPDAQLNKAIDDIDDLYHVDDQYSGGPNILDYELKPYDDRLGPSDYVNIDNVRRYANDDMPQPEYYNETIADLAAEDPYFNDYIDYLDAEDVVKYKGAADRFRNAINQADYNDIVIGDPRKYHPIISKSAQDLAKDIENGSFKLQTRYPVSELISSDKLLKDAWLDDIEHKNYSITQQDLENIMSTYPEISVKDRPEYFTVYKEMLDMIAQNPSKEAEIRSMYSKLIREIEAIDALPGSN